VHGRVVFSDVVRGDLRSTAPQLSISQKALGTLPEHGNVIPKHVGATIHNSFGVKGLTGQHRKVLKHMTEAKSRHAVQIQVPQFV
jgi:hypothetical protein